MREQAQQLPMLNERFEQIFHQDFKHCTCELPFIAKKWHAALGRFVAIRYCCMAKAVEELTGVKLFEVYDFDPTWVWDCDELHEALGPDNETVVKVPRGKPPEWLLKRFQEKGVEVLNLE